MAKKGGKLKRFFLVLVLLALAAVAFILLGGDELLKSSGIWLHGVGTKAGDVKQSIEHRASTVEKTVEKGIEDVKPGEKK